MRPKKPKSNVRNSFQYNMCLDLEDLLDVPNDGKGGAYQICRAIFDSMAAVLHRGGSINIPGLGTFEVKTKHYPRHATRHYFNQTWDKPRQHPDWVVEDFPPKKYVHFTPHKSIVEALNADQ